MRKMESYEGGKPGDAGTGDLTRKEKAAADLARQQKEVEDRQKEEEEEDNSINVGGLFD